jgi:hypothetical protein
LTIENNFASWQRKREVCMIAPVWKAKDYICPYFAGKLDEDRCLGQECMMWVMLDDKLGTCGLINQEQSLNDESK